MDPRCQSGFFKAATHDYEIVDKTVIRNEAAESAVKRITHADVDLTALFNSTRPTVVITMKCKLCGCIDQRSHR